MVSRVGEAPFQLPFADVSCIVDHLHLAATEAGLGSVYIYGVFQRAPELCDYLQAEVLPKGEVPLGGLAVGIPKRPLKTRPECTDIKLDWIE